MYAIYKFFQKKSSDIKYYLQSSFLQRIESIGKFWKKKVLMPNFVLHLENKNTKFIIFTNNSRFIILNLLDVLINRKLYSGSYFQFRLNENENKKF